MVATHPEATMAAQTESGDDPLDDFQVRMLGVDGVS